MLGSIHTMVCLLIKKGFFKLNSSPFFKWLARTVSTPSHCVCTQRSDCSYSPVIEKKWMNFCKGTAVQIMLSHRYCALSQRAGSSVIGTNSDTFSSAQNQHPTVGRTSASLASLKCLVWTDVECEGADIWVRLTPWPRSLRDRERIVKLQMTKSSRALGLRKHSFYSHSQACC